MRKTIAATLALLLIGCTPLAPSSPLVIEGFFDDWAAAAPLGSDPAGDGGASGVDFTDVAAAHTDDLLVISIDLGKVVNLQSEPALVLTLSAGGPELNYDFAARTGSLGDARAHHYEIGLASNPTVTSDRFEIALSRAAAAGDTPLFVDGAPVILSFADPNPGGDVAGPFTYAWDNPAPAPAPLSHLQIMGTIRVLSYNVLNDGVMSALRADHFQRILTALDPDIIAFQELENRTAAAVEARMEEWLGGDWHARKQADLVTVSRYPFVEGWPETQRPLHPRIFPAMLDVDGRQLIVFNAHLFCCAEDAGRQDQADGFAAFVRDYAPEGVPFILAGDLNLVGDARQLVTLLTGDIADEAVYGPDAFPDTDGTPLADAVPRHLLSPHTYTWFDTASAFSAGRLDYVIYTDSLLEATGFVLDSTILPADLLEILALRAHDTLEASDHLPVVVDLVFIE
ncbi:MAG TPA: endonuclease/exonuclease/phosphatase family protein [Anaerolineales bacterium]|nr:endonuclease/exonuclease/phosphatase family protein [Anaerolineales bacterium]